MSPGSARRLLKVLGAVGIVLAILPGFRFEGGPERESRTYTAGFSGSPLFEHHRSQATSAHSLGNVVHHTRRTELGLVSWSSVSLALGVVFLLLARRMR